MTNAGLSVNMPGKVIILDYFDDLPITGIKNTLYIVRYNDEDEENTKFYEWIENNYNAFTIEGGGGTSVVGNFTRTVAAYADIGTEIPLPQIDDLVIVMTDETHDNDSTIYIYDGAAWEYVGKFTATTRDFEVNPLDINTETTGILLKGNYEKQNALETPIIDPDDNFISEDVNGALAELFTYANDIISRVANAVGNPLNATDAASEMENKLLFLKASLASAITGKGVVTYPYSPLAEMIDNVKAIPVVQLGGILKRTAKLNVTAPYTHNITLSEQLTVNDIATSVLEYVGGDSGIVRYEAEYDNSEFSSFIYDENGVVFDGFMRIRDEWDYPLIEIEEVLLYESEEIDFAHYADLESFVVGSEEVIITGIQSTQEVVKASSDIFIVSVETMDTIEFTNVVSGAGISKIAMSFDSGTTWQSWSGSAWIVIDVDDKEDFRSKGMDSTVINGLTDDELSIARNDSETIRFAYYLERPTYADVANNDSIKLLVSMLGYNILADTADYTYSYDPVTKTLSFTFGENGTYQINYVDGS